MVMANLFHEALQLIHSHNVSHVVIPSVPILALMSAPRSKFNIISWLPRSV